ncbi:MAG TPA: hemolysin family protein [Phycisphaerales bacterium]|nr:hemolysin family protein [Phycisphaerales bacterium]
MFPTTLFIILIVSVLVSLTCSTIEAVLLSISPAHIEGMVKQGSKAGRMLKGMRAHLGRPLAAILAMNTIANTVGGTASGAATSEWAARAGLPNESTIAVVAGIFTVLILIFGEVIPKTIGATYTRALAAPTAYILHVLIIVLYPLVLALDLIARVFARGKHAAAVTRDDMLVMSEMGRRSGSIAHRETEVIANLLRLNLIRTRDVLTPRVEVFVLQKDMTAAEVVTKHPSLRHSRIPLYGKNPDNIVGIVLRSQILEACLRGEGSVRLDRLKSSIHVVPEFKSLASLLDEFIKRHEHMFLVVNEYGGTEGIVTLEDVIEALLGVEINDEMDSVERMRQMAITRLREQKRPAARKPIAPPHTTQPPATHPPTAHQAAAPSEPRP